MATPETCKRHINGAVINQFHDCTCPPPMSNGAGIASGPVVPKATDPLDAAQRPVKNQAERELALKESEMDIRQRKLDLYEQTFHLVKAAIFKRFGV